MSMANNFGFQLVGSSPAFVQVKAHIERMAKVDATVLIEGATGTGKEMVARALHYLGARSARPFVPVNCGALAEALIESELFGHERGAFTDAKSSSAGLIGEAGGGTLFLDEVDSLSLKAQAALLRFLQDGSYRRVGSGQSREADVRVIVASNANLEQLCKERRFRLDLLYRINVLSLRLPCLRDRGDDVVELAKTFLARLARQYQRGQCYLTPAALSYLRAHTWPGNVRELENVIHRAMLMTEGPAIELTQSTQLTPTAAGAAPGLAFGAAKRQAVGEFERNYLSQLIEQTQGNLTRAAQLAGKDRSAFGRLVKKYGLSPAQSAP